MYIYRAVKAEWDSAWGAWVEPGCAAHPVVHLPRRAAGGRVRSTGVAGPRVDRRSLRDGTACAGFQPAAAEGLAMGLARRGCLKPVSPTPGPQQSTKQQTMRAPRGQCFSVTARTAHRGAQNQRWRTRCRQGRREAAVCSHQPSWQVFIPVPRHACLVRAARRLREAAVAGGCRARAERARARGTGEQGDRGTGRVSERERRTEKGRREGGGRENC